MSHEFESGVFMRGLKAWHSLGKVLDVGDEAETNATLAMQKGDCSWSASMRSLWMYNPLHESDPSQPKGMKIPGVRAIVRDTDSKILGNAGDVPRGEGTERFAYQLFQNADMAKWAQPILDAKEGKIEAVASLFGGQRVYLLVRLGHNGDSHADIVPGDSVVNHWLIANDFSGKHSLRVARCRTRVVCANTLAAAYGEGTYVKIRHSKNMFVTLDELQTMMRKEHEAFGKDVDLFRTLARKSVTKKMLREYVQSVFPESFKEKKETATEKKIREKKEEMMRRAAEENRVAGKALVDELLGDMFSQESKDKMGREPVLVSDILDRVEVLMETADGATIPGVRGTMWGAVNAVNQYIDREHGRGVTGVTEKRRDNLIFGQGATWNALALQKAMDFGRMGS